MSKTIGTKILLRNDTAARWTSNNPILSKGEIGVEIDTKKFKFGDGTTPWNSLNYGAGADINVPTKTSDLVNDSGFITTSDIPEGAAASTTVPKMDGTATIGTELAFARGDHIHPSDTTKVDKVTGKGLSTEDYTTAEKTKLAGIATGAQVNVQSDWNATSGDAAILNKPTTLAGYGITDAMTATAIEQAINNAVTSLFTYKGTKATIAQLPSSGNTVGDVWHVTATGGEYIWNGTDWQELGSTIDLSGYLQEVSVAGVSLTPSSYSITANQLKTQLGLADAAYKGVDTTISTGSTSSNVPTTQAVVSYITNSTTKVQSSNTNGNIKINNVETTVYTLPSTVLDSSDILILDCGTSTTNYT